MDTINVDSIAFTVIIPAFNSEDWLEEAVDSCLNQTIGSENLQIVIVDDGSSDDTGRIADQYSKTFPASVEVIHQTNQGVAAARNAGIMSARGRYISFLDSDDCFSEDALETVFAFFEEHYDECDMVAIQLQMFGEKTGPHWNNKNRFVESRVIDLNEEWNNPQPSAGGTFFKSQVLTSGKISFDPRLFIMEDATVNALVVLNKLRYGVVADAIYYNRRHEAGVSLVSSASQRVEYYTGVPKWAHLHLIQESLSTLGYVPRFIQSQIAYDLIFRFRDRVFGMQPEEIQEEYLDTLNMVLASIDDEVILSQNATIEEKFAILGHKYKKNVWENATENNGCYYLGSTLVFRVRGRKGAHHRKPICEITEFECKDNLLTIQGQFRCMRFPSMTFGFLSNGEFYSANPDTRSPLLRSFITGDVERAWRFSAQIPLPAGATLAPAVRINSAEEPRSYRLVLRMGQYAGFAGNGDLPYFRRQGSSLFRQTSESRLRREELTTLTSFRRELGFLRRAKKHGAPAKTLLVRELAQIKRALEKKPVWIMGDRKLDAGDNAEALFRFLCGRQQQDLKPVMWLSKSSKTRKELQKLGTVVEPNSFRHQLEYLSSTWTVTSAADEFILNPLGPNRTYLNDLRPKYQGFLQHGITQNDQSSWLNHWDKNFDLFVTSAVREQESILEDKYGYSTGDVVLTGMPRFDRLEDDPKGILVVAPTWRKELSGKLDKDTGRNIANPNFQTSEYFEFWQKLISDERLNSALERAGMKGLFALHPSHSAEVDKFSPGSRFKISPYPHDYRQMFTTGNILLTDYSSVAFDFAYLRKPVVYAQADRDEFFRGHLYDPGYYSYDDDGFGPVSKSYDATIKDLIELIEAKCHISPMYLNRINQFFAFSDKENSRRVFEAMNSISEPA